MKHSLHLLTALSLAATSFSYASAETPTEADYYPIHTVKAPEGVLLEVGGIAQLPEGRIAVSTRRGQVWLIDNPTMQGGLAPEFKLFAEGMHESLGLLFHQGDLYAAQNGELTRLRDTNGDERADIYETVAAWPLSAFYHEYSFGPKLAEDGTFFVTTNIAFGDEEWWRGESRVPWRGWALKIHPDGEIEPWATGLRSPAGLGMYEGELFYTDNQGDWVGSGGLWHLEKGDFVAHPAGLRWAEHASSPVEMTEAIFEQHLDHRQMKNANGFYIKPENIPDEKDPDFNYELLESFPNFRLPAVILPHGILGVSNAEIVVDESEGNFGPFSGQLFVGDQGQSKIMRVSLEKVQGEYQGVAFDFRSGFQSGVLRLDWGPNQSLFAGQTNRGWGSAGDEAHGLEFIEWNGKVPFEMKTVRAKPDGFEIEFTKPVDKETALDLASYSGRSYIYKYHPAYGSPQHDIEDLEFTGVHLSDDRLKAYLTVANLRQYYVHEIHARDLRDAENNHPLLHASAFYTLNAFPQGEGIDRNLLSTRRSEKKALDLNAQSPDGGIDPAVAQELLMKNTCTACHHADKRVIGPSFSEIAQRDYSPERIVELIYKPEPENWPDYATPMAPMPHVPEAEALAIARYINSLKGSNKAPAP
ncbi:c-type cytochrome [Pelagicoccus mobilis]|uniref:Cytochrome c domain-containing protein n=1 Tax=Pelagicoccus mobilis TaxID=415221 RepID=A0A934RYP3_9BACT|nr:c-type cytochrome [Pelagicoccus mobilis]MBK1876279.1 hypothetical protein [Pelagicoccus mobilis]